MTHVSPTASTGSAEALATLRPQVFRYVLGFVRDRGEADDLTQETFLHAYRRLASLRDPDAVLPWLYSIATHVCLDRLRERKRRGAHESDVDPVSVTPADPGPAGAARVERSEMSQCVSGYVGVLSESYRAVLMLHDVHGLTCREIADLLGDSVGSVKVRLHRARQRLREKLASECSFSYDDCGTLVCEPVA